MNCPRCGFPDSRVVDSRKNDTYINRRRVCRRCGFRFQTVEIAALDEVNFTRLQTLTRKISRPRQFENMVYLMYAKIFEKRLYKETKGWMRNDGAAAAERFPGGSAGDDPDEQVPD